MYFSGFNILPIPVLRRRVVLGDIFQGRKMHLMRREME